MSSSGSKQYPYPSHVNPAGFVSVKLTGRFSYQPWQEQMMCLMENYDMLGFIDGSLKNPRENIDTEDIIYREWKRSDTLVKGWIFGSLSENAMGVVVGLQTAYLVWDKLKTTYTTPPVMLPSPAPITPEEIDEGKYVSLCRAIETGDMKNTQEFLKKNDDALTAKLNSFEERVLHVAVGNPDNISILNYLLSKIDAKLLPTLVDRYQQNALHYAAKVDNKKAAKILVEKNNDLLFTIDRDNCMPIERAIINSHATTFSYLFKVCEQHISPISQNEELHNPFEGKHAGLLLVETILSGIPDVAYKLINMNPELATTKVNDKAPLYYIAKKWDAYPSAKRYNFYQRFVYSHVPLQSYNLDNKPNNEQDIENQERHNANLNPILEWIYVKFWKVTLLHVKHIKLIHDEKVKHKTVLKILEFICEQVRKLHSGHDEHYEDAFLVAVENNTPEVLRTIIKFSPQSIWTCDNNDYNLSQLSIIHRSENVFNFLVHEVTQDKYLHYRCVDEFDNNLLHLAGRLAPTHKLNMVTGAALQMQRELQWFQEVKKIMRSNEREQKNDKEETPILTFRIEHEDLRKKGEDWMKKTADSYTITAALIITIVFAAAITVPGGNKEDTGRPNFETRSSFIIFVVADAISLFASTTSLLLFLSILTARYAEDDFLYKLPKRLILGLVMLFMSVTTMMIAFSAALYIMFGQEKSWILIPVAALTCLPIASFVTLQLPLLYDLISSTYGRGIFYEGNKLRLKSSTPYKPKSTLLAN